MIQAIRCRWVKVGLWVIALLIGLKGMSEAITQTSLTFENVTLTQVDGMSNKKRIGIPLVRRSEKAPQTYVYSGFIRYRPWSQHWINVIPDDEFMSMKINDRIVSLSEVKQSGLVDSNQGFDLNIGPYLRTGANKVTMIVKDHGGLFGLNVRPSFGDPRLGIMWGVLIVWCSVVLYRILQCCGFPRSLVIILVVGLMAKFAYLGVTPWDVRSHDVGGHLDYVKFVTTRLSLPARSDGPEFYQPPLYYMIAGGFVRLCSLGADMRNKELQVCSLLLFVVYEIVSISIFRKLDRLFYSAKDSRSQPPVSLVMIMSMLFVFWPSNIVHSVRIGNDVLSYALYSLGMWFLVTWQEGTRNIYLWASAVVAVLSLFTKGTGIILVILILVVFTCVAMRNGKGWRNLVVGAGVCTIMLMGLIPTVGSAAIRRMNGVQDYCLVKSSHLAPEIYVGNRAANYLYFDLKGFVTYAFTDPWKDNYGRQYFWNYFLKTCLFGEFRYPEGICEDLAVVMSVSLLAMLLHMARGLCLMEAHQIRVLGVAMISFALLLSAELCFRFMVPTACCNDFRYIAPILVSFSTLYGFAIHRHREKRHVVSEYAGYCLAIVFSTSSFLFIWFLRA